MLRVVGKYNPGMLRRFLIVCLFSPFAGTKDASIRIAFCNYELACAKKEFMDL